MKCSDFFWAPSMAVGYLFGDCDVKNDGQLEKLMQIIQHGQAHISHPIGKVRESQSFTFSRVFLHGFFVAQKKTPVKILAKMK